MDTVIALGTFDGMHPGHLAVIDRAVKEARERGLTPMVYTFRNNPKSLFGASPRELMTLEERERAMLDRGIERVVFVEFDQSLATMPPRTFARMLKDEYHMALAVAGEDYTFGKMAKGTVRELEQYGREMGFQVAAVKLVKLGGEKVSSTRMRDAAEKGDEALYQALSKGKGEKA